MASILNVVSASVDTDWLFGCWVNLGGSTERKDDSIDMEMNYVQASTSVDYRYKHR